MIGNHLVLSLIPARAKSKSIKNKNFIKVKGKLLIEFTIEAAIKSKHIDEVYISSDLVDVNKTINNTNVKIIKRPKKYSHDNSLAKDVVLHFLKKINPKILNKNPYIVYLQPTSPLRKSNHIDKAIKQIHSSKNKSLISVKKIDSKFLKIVSLDNNKKIKEIFKKSYSNLNRQQFPNLYLLNGAIYIFKALDFLKKENFFINKSLPFIMNEISSIDIDTKKDLINLKKFL